MALRLIEMVLDKEDGENLEDLLKDHKMLEHKQVSLLGGEVLTRILLEADQSEAVLDLLQKKYSKKDGYRVVILPVQATLPRSEPEPDQAITKKEALDEEKTPERVSREELYEDIKGAVKCSRTYLAMVFLSTIVAVIGLQHNSVAILIGAMVIAPLLGPNMALSFSTTLGDLPLLWQALRTSMIGLSMVIIISVILGTIIHIPQVMIDFATNIQVGTGHVILALASGCAGAIAFTSGVSATLVGVMVSVALLPPLVTFGLLLGSGNAAVSVGSLLIVLVNLICINLSAIVTFLIQGITPLKWWEKNRAAKATKKAIILWVTLLAILIGLIILVRI